jgi:outer membrane lipase/esterase
MILARAAALMLALAPLAVEARTAAYSSVVFFGDSLTDSGNAAILSPGAVPPVIYPNGQFTNGDVWATQLGATAALLGGTNFAVGGARATGAGSSPGFDEQIDLALPFRAAYGPRPLAAVWIGSNDLRDAFAAPDPFAAIPVVIAAAVDAIGMGIDRLVEADMRNFVVLGVPDLSLLPGIVGTANEGPVGDAVDAFNAALLAELAMPGRAAQFTYVDTDALLNEVVTLGPALGITQPDTSCIVTPLGDSCIFDSGPTADYDLANAFVFYDDIHPTVPVHSYLAGAFAAAVPAVPLPAGLPLTLGALALLAALARARARAANA